MNDFNDCFFEIANHKIQPGQVIACYTCPVYLADSYEKRDLIKSLIETSNYESAFNYFKKIFHSTDEAAYTVLKQMAVDLLETNGDIEFVARKDYKYVAESFFYTYKENIPKDDPYWSIVSLLKSEDVIVNDDTVSSKIEF